MSPFPWQSMKKLGGTIGRALDVADGVDHAADGVAFAKEIVSTSERIRASGESCSAAEGCAGRGWLWDLSDDGSGREVYCDCAAGVALRLRDEERKSDENER